MTTNPPSPESNYAQGNLFQDRGADRTLHDEAEAIRARQKNLINEKNELRHYLERLSVDTSGTEPREHFSPEEAKLCREFIADFDHSQNPRKENLSLQVAETREKLWGSGTDNVFPGLRTKTRVWGSGIKYTPIPLRTIWSGAGFNIGHIVGNNIVSNSTGYEIVYLCLDGKLRCTRNPGIFDDSYGVGVGTLPRQNVELVPEETLIYQSAADRGAIALSMIDMDLRQVLADFAIHSRYIRRST